MSAEYRLTFRQKLTHPTALSLCACWTCFYRAVWNADAETRSSDENSVRPTVHPSVRQTRELWQNERKITIDFYTVRKNI